MSENAAARPVPVTYDQRGEPRWVSRMSPPDDSFAQCLMVPDRIIPVIFVPGVMGSNLIEKGAKGKEGVKWRLDGPDSAAAWAYPTRDAEFRKRYLRPEVMQVDAGGAIPAGTAQQAEELRRRGWGEVGALSYAPFLVWLENALNDFENPHPGERVKLLKDELQAMVGEELLSDQEVSLSYRYRFPVHACGYNWLGSNADAAALLGKRIDDVIRRYTAENKRCEKVIIVTHSMGGLVARHCSQVGDYEGKIFGVVHGVMPAIGAAAVYRRFKAGTENSGAGKGLDEQLKGWVATLALGSNAAEMTAVLSSAPGPLQLLPTPEYGNGWLKVKDGGQEFSFPQKSDPYGEIYAVRGKWWSMCEDTLVNPMNRERDPIKRQAKVDADRAKFEDLIREEVKSFHVDIRGLYHATTHAFFGSHSDNRAYGNVTWTGSSGLSAATVFKDRKVDVLDARPLTPAELKDQHRPEPEIHGTRTVDATYTDRSWFPHTQRRYYISEPDEDGDGTVPRRSGMAPKATCKSFLQVNVGHEPAYKYGEGLDNLRACRFTLRAIVKIAQNVQQTSLKYD
jgi:hypothetical protein